MDIEITKMTSKGQVVIPQSLRQSKGIKKGEKFLVYDIGENIVLKRVKGLEKSKNINEGTSPCFKRSTLFLISFVRAEFEPRTYNKGVGDFKYIYGEKPLHAKCNRNIMYLGPQDPPHPVRKDWDQKQTSGCVQEL